MILATRFIRAILKKYTLECWLVVSIKSSSHKQRLFQLFVFYIDEDAKHKFIVVSQANKFSQVCTDNDELIWHPETKRELTFSFKNNVVNLPNVRGLSKFFQKFKKAGHMLSIMTPDEIKSYSTKPTMGFWRGYQFFVTKTSKAWGITRTDAALLVSRNQTKPLQNQNQFFERCNLGMQQRLHLLLEIERNLDKAFDGDKQKKQDWLNTVNENFTNLSAFDLMCSDPAGVVIVHQNSTWIMS